VPALRRAAPILLWILALAMGLVVIARTTFQADLSAFLPANPDAEQRLLTEQLRSGIGARTLLVAIEGGDGPARAEASRQLRRALAGNAAFEQVQNGERDDWHATGALLLAHRYQLSATMDPSHFEAAGLREAIVDTLALVGSPQGAIAGANIERDPTGETQRIAESLLPANAPRVEDGVWVSRIAPRAVLLVTTRAAGADLDAQAAAIALVRGAFAPSAARGLRLVLSGPPMFSVDSRARIEHEARLLGGIGLVLVGTLLLAAFASTRALLAAMLPVATGAVAGVVATSLAFGGVHGLTLAFGTTLIGEAVDYAIYFLIQARAGGWQQWRGENWPTVRLGLLTSVCGFAVMVASGFPGLAQLGVFSVAGLVAAALATRFVLPMLMPQGAAGRGVRRRLGTFASAAARALPRARLAFALIGLACAGVVAVGGARLWRGDLASLSPVGREAMALDASLRADLGASDARTLVVANGADLQAALRGAERAGAVLDALVDAGAIAGYDSPARLLPSIEMQRRRQQAIPDAATLRARLAEASRGTPLAFERLEPFLREAQAARDAAPLTAQDLAGTPLRPALDALVFKRAGGGWTALLPLQPGRQDVDAAQVRRALAGAGPGIDVVDIKQSLDDLYARYLREALTQSLAGAVAVVMVIAVHLRSARRTGAVVLPLALAVVLTMGGLAAFGVALGILHLIGLLLVVAIGSNYGLFFDHWRAGGHADPDTLASLLLANLTAVIAFGLLAFSSIPALSALGRVVAPGVFLALTASAAFILARPAPARGP
jgi:predicted exporter